MIQDLRHIRAFLALARAGSFMRAAAELNMAQPTLTVQIQQLEDAVGVRLFDRSIIMRAGRSLSPTADRLKQTLEQVVRH